MYFTTYFSKKLKKNQRNVFFILFGYEQSIKRKELSIVKLVWNAPYISEEYYFFWFVSVKIV